ncbi:alpha/beta hydrolase family protein [Rubrimonas sp.]|uniref:alpha/beta hydrolase family protein n=1 Tax=Rubrimonas sp. TaxID=2036015 RepID=UPI002FDDEAB1
MPPHRTVAPPSAAAFVLVCLASGAAADLDGCATAPARHAPAPERTIRIDTPEGVIAGTLAAPANAAPVALALLLHGFTGARDEIPVEGREGMFARAARAFAERGVASLRIDFRGSGESAGRWADTTFTGQARDALRAGAALTENAEAPLVALGYSQGGLVALRAAAMDDVFERIALWNPVLDPRATYGLILGVETLALGAVRHEAGARDDLVGASGLKPAFFADIASADPLADAARTDAPVLVVTGRRDHLVRDGAAFADRIAAGRVAETQIVDLEAGHDLGAASDAALLDEVIACTAAFLLGVR